MIELKPCPFCGQEPEQTNRRYNPYARCATPDCAGGKLPLISLDVPDDIELWNRRYREQALVADVEMLSELLRRMVAAMHAYEMDVDWDHPPPRDHRAMMADAYSAIEDAPATSLARLKAQWQREALERLRTRYCNENGSLFAIVDDEIEQLRRQAEGGDHD
jgi:hypothetical protein